MTPEQREVLEQFRRRLDAIDDALIDLLAERARVVSGLWAWKEGHQLPRADPAREAAVIARLLERAHQRGLDTSRVRPILEAIIGQPLASAGK